MPIEFREIRRGEADQALAFARTLGSELSRQALVPRLSLLAVNSAGQVLGCALHHRDAGARPTVTVRLCDAAHPGLARLLIDRALRKAAAAGLSTTHVHLPDDPVAAATWSQADWLARLVA